MAAPPWTSTSAAYWLFVVVGPFMDSIHTIFDAVSLALADDSQESWVRHPGDLSSHCLNTAYGMRLRNLDNYASLSPMGHAGHPMDQPNSDSTEAETPDVAMRWRWGMYKYAHHPLHV